MYTITLDEDIMEEEDNDIDQDDDDQLIICISGSRTQDDIINKLAKKYENDGNIVLKPTQSIKPIGEENIEKLVDLHYKKIDISDCCVFIEKEDGMGEHTRGDYEYAQSIDKPSYVIKYDNEFNMLMDGSRAISVMAHETLFEALNKVMNNVNEALSRNNENCPFIFI